MGIIALGFISNGILELIRARYREIRITWSLSFGHGSAPRSPKNAGGAETTVRLETSNGS